MTVGSLMQVMYIDFYTMSQLVKCGVFFLLFLQCNCRNISVVAVPSMSHDLPTISTLKLSLYYIYILIDFSIGHLAPLTICF